MEKLLRREMISSYPQFGKFMVVTDQRLLHHIHCDRLNEKELDRFKNESLGLYDKLR